ncbi:hypothetical protein OG474_24685 [Kribbella sp. NBC_01505]|uniref:hypothetical protein n=1 Tax=Kribbella sp. NBC_01505 TaxID=2903580 RepID=UPI00386FB3D1
MRQSRGVRWAVGAAALLLVVGCQSDQVKDTMPLPMASVLGKVVCGFVSQDSIVKALGTADFSLAGSSQDLGGGTNPDGSKLNEAACSAKHELTSVSLAGLKAPHGTDLRRCLSERASSALTRSDTALVPAHVSGLGRVVNRNRLVVLPKAV